MAENDNQAQESKSAMQPKAEQPAQKSDSKLLTGLFIVVVLALGAASAYNYSHIPRAQPTVQQKFVVLDTKLLLTASTKQITDNKDLTLEQASEVSLKLANNLKKVIESYRDQGYVVLNGNSLVTWPATIDITKQTADQLGVQL